MILGYYDRDGIPITLWEWAKLFKDIEYKRVDFTWMMDGATGDVKEISTVWLGLDHNVMGYGPPLIFETMVFSSGSMLDEKMERYSTLAEACEGHTFMIIDVAQEMTEPIPMEREPE